jgi:hypothetical protein
MAYLVRPQSTHLGVSDGYRNRWDSIKDVVGQIVPQLKDEERWKDIVYDRLDPDDQQLKFGANGKVLFKFDPDHEGKRKATLWVEANYVPYHDDVW